MSRGSRPGCADGARGPKCSPHGEGAPLHSAPTCTALPSRCSWSMAKIKKGTGHKLLLY